MFLDSLPATVLSMVMEHVRPWPDTDIYVGPSGSFAIERSLASLGRPLHSNDVTIYSCAIGAYLAGQPVPIEFAKETLTEFPWLEGSLGASPEQDLATLMLCSQIATAFGRQNQAFLARLVDGYHHQWAVLLDKTTAKLADAAAGVKLASFHAEDIATWIDRVPADAPVASFLPSADTDAVFKRLAAMFTWQAPPHDPLTAEQSADLIAKIVDREHWLLALNEPNEEFDDRGLLRGRSKSSPRSKEIFVYASGGHRRVVTSHQTTEPVLIPKLGADEGLRPDADVALVSLSPGQFDHLRSVYLNRNIAPARSGNLGVQCGVLVDGTLVGAFCLSSYAGFGVWKARLTAPTIYLLSDFPVAPVGYKHLAKLVVMAAMSTDARFMLERTMHRRFKSIATHAYTQRPVSMKYRGVMELLDRAERGDGKPGYALAYGGPFGDLSLADTYTLWHEKYGARIGDPEPSEQPKGRRGRRNKP